MWKLRNPTYLRFPLSWLCEVLPFEGAGSLHSLFRRTWCTASALPPSLSLRRLWGAQQWILSFLPFVLRRYKGVSFFGLTFLTSCASRAPPRPIIFRRHISMSKTSGEKKAAFSFTRCLVCAGFALTPSCPSQPRSTLAKARSRTLFRNQNHGKKTASFCER